MTVDWRECGEIAKGDDESISDSSGGDPFSGSGGGSVWLGVVGGQPDGEVEVSWEVLRPGVG